MLVLAQELYTSACAGTGLRRAKNAMKKNSFVDPALRRGPVRRTLSPRDRSATLSFTQYRPIAHAAGDKRDRHRQIAWFFTTEGL